MQQFEAVLFFIIHVCAQNQRNSDFIPKPETCHRPAEFMYRQCCVFPPFFTRDIAKSCGAIFRVNFIDKENNVTGFRRNTMTSGCEHWECVLKKYNFLTKDKNLDDEKFFTHLDKWAELNPSFNTILTNAQIHCKNEYRMFMPLTACEFSKIHGCIRNFINIDCPVVIPTPKCMETKLFYDECREFFL